MRRILLLALPLLLLLSGCSSLFNQEYRRVVPHPEQHVQTGEQTDMQASNITELKTGLSEFIRQRGDKVRIKLNDYTGDSTYDVSQACYDIKNEDPIAAYTVSYMSPEYMPLGNEVEVSVFYRPNLPDDIPKVSNLSALTDALTMALKTFQKKLVLEVGYFDESGADFNALLRAAYYRLPEQAVGLPTLNFSLYPPSGSVSRVVDMTLGWPDATQALQQRVSQANQALSDLYGDMPDGLEPPYQALWLYDRLCADVAYDAEAAASQPEADHPSDADDNLYTAMAENRAVSAGYALAYQLLCEKAGIECRLVTTGWRDNVQYVWNVICLDGDWYHVDAAADAAAGAREGAPTHDWFLKTDEEMQAVARWTQSDVPKCNSSEYSYEMLIMTPAAVDGPVDETPAVTAGTVPPNAPPDDNEGLTVDDP